jgi:hypothetical protein
LALIKIIIFSKNRLGLVSINHAEGHDHLNMLLNLLREEYLALESRARITGVDEISLAFKRNYDPDEDISNSRPNFTPSAGSAQVPAKSKEQRDRTKKKD